jgi:hypothetical protein
LATAVFVTRYIYNAGAVVSRIGVARSVPWSSSLSASGTKWSVESEQQQPSADEEEAATDPAAPAAADTPNANETDGKYNTNDGGDLAVGYRITDIEPVSHPNHPRGWMPSSAVGAPVYRGLGFGSVHQFRAMAAARNKLSKSMSSLPKVIHHECRRHKADMHVPHDSRPKSALALTDSHGYAISRSFERPTTGTANATASTTALTAAVATSSLRGLQSLSRNTQSSFPLAPYHDSSHSRLGAFEVQVAYKDEQGHVFIETIHSKLATQR